MDDTQRKITKIAREAAKFTVQTMKAEGIGTAEFDFIHLVRHKPGITQAEIRETLDRQRSRCPPGCKPGSKGLSGTKTKS